jgi:hypothetical protein
MTQISPRAARDLQDHYARLHRATRHQRLAHMARDAILPAALLATAALTGWALAAAQATCTALPDIIAQSQTLAAW